MGIIFCNPENKLLFPSITK